MKLATIRKTDERCSVVTFLLIKAEVRDEHKSQLVSSFKEDDKQCLSFYSKLSFFIYFHIIIHLVKHTRIKVQSMIILSEYYFRFLAASYF